MLKIEGVAGLQLLGMTRSRVRPWVSDKVGEGQGRWRRGAKGTKGPRY